MGTEATNQTTKVTQTTENTTTQNTNNFDDEQFYTKMDGMLAKRFDGVIKSIMEANGATSDEAKEFISNYRTRNESKQKQVTDEINALKTENEKLKNTIYDSKIKTSVADLAEKIGFNTKYTSQIIKLANLDDVKVNGDINAEKLEAAIKAVVDDCEAFKAEEKKEPETTGFKKVGAESGADKPEDSLAKIRKAMGLK